MQYVPIAIAFLGALIAIRGKTWNEEKTSWRALTGTGWVVGVLAVAACTTQIILTHKKIESAEHRERIAWEYLESTAESAFFEAGLVTEHFLRGGSFGDRDAQDLRVLLREVYRDLASDIANHRSWIAVDDLRKIEVALLEFRDEEYIRWSNVRRVQPASNGSEGCRTIRDPLDITLNDIEPTTAQALSTVQEILYLSSSIFIALCPDADAVSSIRCGLASDVKALDDAIYGETVRRETLARINQLRNDPDGWAHFEKQLGSLDPADADVQRYFSGGKLLATECANPEEHGSEN